MNHVAILIPSAGERRLANLARDAIAKFTTDVSHEVWLLDHPRGKPWPDNGSQANGAALQAMILGLSPDVTHVFAMHDDALPIRAGWLSYLLTKPGPVVGVKLSQRSGFAHPSGVLWDAEYISANLEDIPADMPTRDVGEFPAAWCASAWCYRLDDTGAWVKGDSYNPSACAILGPRLSLRWPFTFDCDVSFDDKGEPFFAHAGGGTIGAGRENDLQRRNRVHDWIDAARKALDL